MESSYFMQPYALRYGEYNEIVLLRIINYVNVSKHKGNFTGFNNLVLRKNGWRNI